MWSGSPAPEGNPRRVGRLPDDDLSLPQDDLKVVHCGHSDRSMVGISVLERRGYRNLALLEGGYSSWLAAGYRIVSRE
jgi:rhodanese-related sulfurtransferase